MVQDLGKVLAAIWVVCAAVVGTEVRADKVGDLIEKLSDKDATVRCQAAEELGRLKERRAVKPLIDLLEGRQIGSSQAQPGAGVSNAVKKVEEAKLAVGRRGPDLRSAAGQADVGTLQLHVRALKSRSAIDRRNAAIALGQLRDRRAVPSLISAFKADRIGSAQEAILEALGEIGDPRAFDLLMGAMGARHVSTRRAAATGLGKMGDPRAAQPLYAAFTSEAFLRRDAGAALGQLGTSEGVRLLNVAARHEDVFISREAKEVLDDMGPDHGLEPLIALLRDPDPAVVKLAAQALGEIGDSCAVAALEGLANFGSAETRDAARVALTKTGGGSGQASLEDTMVEIARMSAATALGEIGGPDAVQALIRALEDNSEVVARSSGKSLGKMKSTLVMRPFMSALYSNDNNMVMQAVRGLGLIGNDDAVGLLTKALQHSDVDVRKEAVKALGNTQNPLASSALGAVLKDDPFCQEEAVKALGNIGDSNAVEALIAALDNKSAGVRKEAVISLGSMGDPIAAGALGVVARDDGFNSTEAVKALSSIGGSAVVEPLIVALGSTNFVTRREAVTALGATGDKRAVQPLVGLLLKDDRPVMKETIEALVAIGDMRAGDGLIEVVGSRLYREAALAALEKIKWQPSTVRHKVLYHIAKEQWQECVKLGKPAVDPLIEEAKRGNSLAAKALGDIGDREAVGPLAEKVRNWAGGRDYCEALEKLGWNPETLADRVYFMFATRDREGLKRLYTRDSRVRRLIMENLNSDNTSKMFSAANTLIGLARTDAIGPLMSRLRTIKDEDAAISFGNLLLASGNEQLARQTEEWGRSKGYEVVSTHMPGSASWGSW